MICGSYSVGGYSVKKLTGMIRQIEHTDEGTTTWTTLSAKTRTDGSVSEGGDAERQIKRCSNRLCEPREKRAADRKTALNRKT